MSFTSYAQNFEDVVLWRALKHVQNGLYVDVGAQHPVVDSISKAFYERGWRGIHIEPVPEYAELLRKDRPDETVLQVALADIDGTLELNVISGTGLSTAVDAYAQRYRVERVFDHRRIQVPAMTLTSALRLLAGKDVHWLKIDVEGLEEKVLKGWDSQNLRPWVMVVEATIPNSTETDFTSWDPILTEADYRFVYFDGLNRFYVAKEHIELAKWFSTPPNIFDDIELSGLSSWGLCRGVIATHLEREKDLTAQAEKLVIELNAVNEGKTQLEAHAQRLQKDLDAARNAVDQIRNELQAVYSSKSWWLTKPLRKLSQAIKSSFGLSSRVAQWIWYLPRRIMRKVLLRVMVFVSERAILKKAIIRLLTPYPHMKRRLKLMLLSPMVSSDASASNYTHFGDKPFYTGNTTSNAPLSVEELLRRINEELRKAN